MRALIILTAVAVSIPCYAMQSLFGSGAQKTSAVEGINFGYQIYGGDAVGLLQAFDDGKRIYFQFRELDLKQVPQIWSEDSAGHRSAIPVEATAPYIVSKSLERKYVFVFGKGKATREASVVRATVDQPGPSATRLTEPAARKSELGSADLSPLARQCQGISEIPSSLKTINVPFWSSSVRPTKRAQDDLKAFAARMAATHKGITIRGRPSELNDIAAAHARADSIRLLLLGYGFPADRMTITAEASPKPGDDSIFFSEIVYGASSSGFILLDGC